MTITPFQNHDVVEEFTGTTDLEQIIATRFEIANDSLLGILSIIYNKFSEASKIYLSISTLCDSSLGKGVQLHLDISTIEKINSYFKDHLWFVDNASDYRKWLLSPICYESPHDSFFTIFLPSDPLKKLSQLSQIRGEHDDSFAIVASPKDLFDRIFTP